MDAAQPHGVAWVSIDEWIAVRTAKETVPRQARPLGVATPASPDEILSMRRRRSGPGVSHHAMVPPHLRSRRTA